MVVVRVKMVPKAPPIPILFPSIFHFIAVMRSKVKFVEQTLEQDFQFSLSQNFFQPFFVSCIISMLSSCEWFSPRVLVALNCHQWISVNRCLYHFSIFGRLHHWKFAQWHKNCQSSRCASLPNSKTINYPKPGKILKKWQNFAKSGHTNGTIPYMFDYWAVSFYQRAPWSVWPDGCQ